ncbi:MAG: MinD/ParA family protein [Clostridiales bacterium]|nr:MinD/ParA family protein [Clostridiales bacterium]
MRDQAEQLRQIVSTLQLNRKVDNTGCARVITITSGKGGVGKTSFTINLAISLAKMGYRIVIIDGDFGLANVDLMLGISSRYGLREIITGQMSLKEVMVEGPYGIRFISGGSGIKELVNLGSKELDVFLSKIDELNQIADIVLIDTGAGATDNIVKMVLAADEVLLIVTPEPTAITDAYALTKIISTTRRDLVLRLIINKAETVYEAQEILDKFTRAAERFLKIKINSLGYILEDNHIPKSIKEQVPCALSYPRCQASRQIRIVARRLINEDSKDIGYNAGMTSYIRKFLSLFKAN